MKKEIAQTIIGDALRNYAKQNGNAENLKLSDEKLEQMADAAAVAIEEKTEKNRGVVPFPEDWDFTPGRIIM